MFWQGVHETVSFSFKSPVSVFFECCPTADIVSRLRPIIPENPFRRGLQETGSKTSVSGLAVDPDDCVIVSSRVFRIASGGLSGKAVHTLPEPGMPVSPRHSGTVRISIGDLPKKGQVQAGRCHRENDPVPRALAVSGHGRAPSGLFPASGSRRRPERPRRRKPVPSRKSVRENIRTSGRCPGEERLPGGAFWPRFRQSLAGFSFQPDQLFALGRG